MSEANERLFLFWYSPKRIAIRAQRRWQSLILISKPPFYYREKNKGFFCVEKVEKVEEVEEA